MDRLFRRFHHSIAFRAGVIFVALSLVCGVLLLVSSYQTTQLMGTGTAINMAGMQRARAYKLAALIQQLEHETGSRFAREAILEEAELWKRALNSLEVETDRTQLQGGAARSLVSRLEEVQQSWTTQLEPTLQAAMGPPGPVAAAAARRYLAQVDGFVEALSEVVRSLEDSRENQVQQLFVIQISFVLVLVLSALVGIQLLRRLILRPLRTLTQHGERLSASDFHVKIPDLGRDELGQLALTFERLRRSIVQKIDELEALHAVGQGMNTLGPEGLETVLRCIVDRATDVLEADVALLMVRHPTLEFWVVEAVSGPAFETFRNKIVLLEETPFSNKAFDTKQPVVVGELSPDQDVPGRFRQEFGAKSYLAVPLLRMNACSGVLLFMSTAKPRRYSDWDVRLAQHFASYAAVALENAQLFQNVTSESENLKEKLEAVRRSVAELTHEVKAPAGRVAEFASWLEEDYAERLDEKGRRYLAWIRKEGRDLEQLAAKALDLPRLTETVQEIVSVDVRSVADEVLQLLKQDIERNGVQVEVAAEFPRLACRRIHLKQVLENLLSNAMKYMGGQPRPRVVIGWEQRDDGVWLSVSDNGVGIEPEMAERIFEPFQRVGLVDVPGAGVGLAIVKAVVEQYDGAVSVSSTPGTGSTFFLKLPALAGAWPGEPAQAHRDGDGGTAAARVTAQRMRP